MDGFFHRCCRPDERLAEEESMLDRRSRGRAEKGSENEQLEECDKTVTTSDLAQKYFRLKNIFLVESMCLMTLLCLMPGKPEGSH